MVAGRFNARWRFNARYPPRDEIPRRGATVDAVASRGVARGFMRRAATRFIVGAAVRGLKPTATITMSLRDAEVLPGRAALPGRGATTDGSRAFQRPVPGDQAYPPSRRDG